MREAADVKEAQIWCLSVNSVRPGALQVLGAKTPSSPAKGAGHSSLDALDLLTVAGGKCSPKTASTSRCS